ncbi:MAG: FHA domain-containing protein [Acidobacteria bacterium]|nr:FHA domain-containing protein [Acidobacteriota bacterium]
MVQQIGRFVITRGDRSVDPVTVVSEGLAIGRAPDCELHLNHPTVSRLHAGIQRHGADFYLYHFSKSNATTLNGLLVEDRTALSEGDQIQLGPFVVTVTFRDRALHADVRYQTAVRIGDGAVEGENSTVAVAGSAAPDSPTAPAQTTTTEAGGFAPDTDATETGEDAERGDAFALFWDKRKREAGKISAASPLKPHAPPRLGKLRYNWRPTRDLVRPWPLALFTWSLVVVGLLSAAAAIGYTNAFSPAPLSDPHARASVKLAPAVAREPNANSCTTCHTLTARMEQACASCHQTEAFAPATLDAHAAAGVGCVTCHAEHRGREFRPAVASLSDNFQPGVDAGNTCAGCHNDANAKLYNGRRVSTPHGGTIGYPVSGGQWKWEGLSEAAWAAKPEELRKLLTTWPAAGEQARRSQQFHALHLHRLRAVAGLRANAAGELTCSSCHTRLGAALDRDTPRQTCAACHNGLRDEETGRALVAADAPNCTSCHAQHPRVRRNWAAPMLAGR